MDNLQIDIGSELHDDQNEEKSSLANLQEQTSAERNREDADVRQRQSHEDGDDGGPLKNKQEHGDKPRFDVEEGALAMSNPDISDVILE